MRSMLCVPMHGCATGSAPAGKPASTERAASESVRLFLFFVFFCFLFFCLHRPLVSLHSSQFPAEEGFLFCFFFFWVRFLFSFFQ